MYLGWEGTNKQLERNWERELALELATTQLEARM